MAYCPRCGGPVQPGADVCGNCRSPLRLTPLPSATHQAEAESAAYPMPPHQTAAPFQPWPGGFAPPDFPMPFRSGRSKTVMVVLSTMAVTIVLCTLVSFAVVKAGIDPFMKSGMAAAEIGAAIQADMELEELLNSISGEMKGSMDERIDLKTQFIRDYVAEANKMVLNQCPDEFTAAYRRHLATWTDFAEVLAAHPHISTDEEAFVYHVLTGANISDSEEQQDVAAWARRAKEAQGRADQSMRDVMVQAKTSINELGPIWQGLLGSK